MERTRNGNPVAVPANVLEGLAAVRLSGKTNMLDVFRVIELALSMGYPDAALWVYENRSLYAHAIFWGFTVAAVPRDDASSHHVAEPAACGHDAEQPADASEPSDTSQGGK